MGYVNKQADKTTINGGDKLVTVYCHPAKAGQIAKNYYPDGLVKVYELAKC